MAKNKITRIIFDTNWYISHLITGRPVMLDQILIDDTYEIIISEKMEEEFERVVNYSKFRQYFNPETARNYFSFIKARCHVYKIHSTISVCHDSKDNYLLALAKDTDTDYLVTGDKDLLILEKFERTIICTLTDFIEKYFTK